MATKTKKRNRENIYEIIYSCVFWDDLVFVVNKNLITKHTQKKQAITEKKKYLHAK